MDTKAKVLLAVGGVVLVGMAAYLLLPGSKKSTIELPPEASTQSTQPSTEPATQPDPFAPPTTTTSTILGQENTQQHNAGNDPWTVLDTRRTPGRTGVGRTDMPPAPARDDATAIPPEAPKTWRVAAGDTLASISTKVYNSPRYASRIAAANPKVNPRHLKAGATLNLPVVHVATPTAVTPETGLRDGGTSVTPTLTGKTYKVVSGDSLRKIAQKTLGSQGQWEKIYELNKKAIGSDPAKLKVGMVLQLPESGTR